MNENILVSVIVPTYGRNDLLKRAISSIQLQTCVKDLEIIIVDDNMPDSEHRKNNLLLMKEYTNIKYIQHETNKGGCAARNTGIKNAKGKYLGFLDDDDVWNENFVEKHLEKFKLKQNIFLVYCNFYLNRNSISEKVIFNNKSGMIFSELLNGWCPASTSLFLIKKECFEKHGYFDENLKSFQDYDLWLNFSRFYEFDYCDDYLVTKYEHNEGQISLNPITRQLGLNSLKHKWNEILFENEKKVFKDSISEKQKQIYYLEVIKFRNTKKILPFIKSSFNFMRHSNNKFSDFFKILFIFILGYKKLTILKDYYKIRKKKK